MHVLLAPPGAPLLKGAARRSRAQFFAPFAPGCSFLLLLLRGAVACSSPQGVPLLGRRLVLLSSGQALFQGAVLGSSRSRAHSLAPLLRSSSLAQLLCSPCSRVKSLAPLLLSSFHGLLQGAAWRSSWVMRSSLQVMISSVQPTLGSPSQAQLGAPLVQGAA